LALFIIEILKGKIMIENHTIFKLFLLIAIYNVATPLFSMELEPETKKAKTSLLASSAQFLPEFDINQPIIIILNHTSYDLNLWTKNNYFDPASDYFVVDKTYTENFSQYAIAPSADAGPSIRLPSSSLAKNYFAVIPINQLEDTISILLQKKEKEIEETVRFIIPKKLLQNKDRTYSSIMISLHEHGLDKRLHSYIYIENGQIKKNIKNKLIRYKIDSRFNLPYIPDIPIVIGDINVHFMLPNHEFIYLISESQEQKRALRQEKEMPRLQEYIKKYPQTLEQLLPYARERK
jgi:hypothetical protein